MFVLIVLDAALVMETSGGRLLHVLHHLRAMLLLRQSGENVLELFTVSKKETYGSINVAV